jgi:hypothetical protein
MAKKFGYAGPAGSQAAVLSEGQDVQDEIDATGHEAFDLDLVGSTASLSEDDVLIDSAPLNEAPDLAAFDDFGGPEDDG